MKIKTKNSDKIESMVEYNYRTEIKMFWFGGTHMWWCTQKEYDEYVIEISSKSDNLMEKIEEKIRCDKIPFDGS